MRVATAVYIGRFIRVSFSHAGFQGLDLLPDVHSLVRFYFSWLARREVCFTGGRGEGKCEPRGEGKYGEVGK